MLTISIIIPTYNRAKFIGLTLKSFALQNYPAGSFEIIVVNNNSTDNTKSVVQDLAVEYPFIKYIEETRQGVHYARNMAAKHAQGEILYYTDDDMIADPDLLKNLIPIFDKDPKIACISGRVLPKWEITPPDWIIKYCENSLLSLNLDEAPLIISDKIIAICSCHQAILKNALIEAGGFNPENTKGEWIGDGETGLTIKLLDLGYKLAYTGNSVIHHIIPKERMTQSYLNKRFANQGNCDSYTSYKHNSGLSNKQLRANMAQNFKYLIRHFLIMIRDLLKMRDSWRMALAQLFYIKNRILYDYRLLHDENWRKLVLKNNWID